MEKMKKKKTEKKKGIYLELIFLYLILSTDTLLVATNSNSIFMRLGQIILIIGTIILALAEYKKNGEFGSEIIIIVITIATFFMGMLVNQDFTLGYILKIILILFAFLFSKKVKVETFKKYYLKILIFLSVYSIFIFIFSGVLRELDFLPIIRNIEGIEYKNLIFSNVPMDRYTTMRNYGPFWEPGVFQGYISLALIFLFFNNNEKIDIKKIVILVITMLTTGSTTGIINLILILLAYFFYKDKKNIRTNIRNKIWIIIVALVVLIVIILNKDLHEVLFSKFSKDSINNISFDSRWHSIWSNLKIFMDNILWGAGPSNINALTTLYANNIGYSGTISQTNTILLNFSMFGVVFGVYYVSKLLRIFSNAVYNPIVKILLLLVISNTLISEPLTYSLMFNIIIFYKF